MNTALKELINTLDEQINFGNEDSDKGYKRGLKVAKSLAKSFLKKEKKQIIDAVTYGKRQEHYDGSETIGETYFNETFNS